MNTKCTVFGLTRLGVEPTIYRTLSIIQYLLRLCVFSLIINPNNQPTYPSRRVAQHSGETRSYYFTRRVPRRYNGSYSFYQQCKYKQGIQLYNDMVFTRSTRRKLLTCSRSDNFYHILLYSGELQSVHHYVINFVISPPIKTDRHYIAEILLKAALNPIIITHRLLYHFVVNETYKYMNIIFRL